MHSLNYIWLVVISAALVSARGKKAAEYDYIVVGGGAAGCVVATRLSEDPDVSVLLLEAGYDPVGDPFVSTPRTWFTVFRTPERYDWGYDTEPQSVTNKRVPFYAGKMLGGSSSHNALIFTRGSRYEYERWSEMGNEGWDYQSVLPFFKKLETMTDPRFANNGFHGTEGPVKVRFPRTEPIIAEFFKAAGELGIKEIDDFNGPDMDGFGHIQTPVDGQGHRMSALEAYLRPVLARRNLKVITEVLVTKIIIDKKKGKQRAKGVMYMRNGKLKSVVARREVIVSAGALNTPKLLLLSGVGPKEQLADMGIKVMANLPVGQNLQNHWGIPLPLRVSDTSPIEITKMATFKALFEYVFTGKGPWSAPGYDGVSFFPANSQPQSDRFPYLEQLLTSAALDFPGQFKELRDSIFQDEVIPELVQQFQDNELGYKLILFTTLHNHPRHRGVVKLRSKDPMDKPHITLEYLLRQDMMDLVQGIRRVQDFLNTQALRNAGLSMAGGPDPNCAAHVFDSDDYWVCVIHLKFGITGHHTSSCKMAPDYTGVVDNKLRVKGIAGLRVIDASIMPITLSAHTYAPTLMIAEKGAQMIKDNYFGGKKTKH